MRGTSEPGSQPSTRYLRMRTFAKRVNSFSGRLRQPFTLLRPGWQSCSVSGALGRRRYRACNSHEPLPLFQPAAHQSDNPLPERGVGQHRSGLRPCDTLRGQHVGADQRRFSPLLVADQVQPNPTSFNLSLPFCGRWRYGPWGRSGHWPSAVAEIQRSEVQATSESKSPKRAPFPHCRRRRKESDQRFRGEQVFAAPKNEPETPYVVSYSGLQPCQMPWPAEKTLATKAPMP